ncbi:MAG: hypothetical protein JNK67_17150 [Alphaproteobacteria bacterium]|nr:hypothetical protein [Alphaproteobacteria bacterium]
MLEPDIRARGLKGAKERPPSLLWLIGGRMLLVTLVWLALMIAFVQSEVDRNARALRSQALEQVARTLATHLVADRGDGVAFALPVGAAPSGYDFVIRGPDSRIIASSGASALIFPAPTRLVVPPPPLDPQQGLPVRRDTETVTTPLPDGRIGLGLVLHVDAPNGGSSTVLVSEDASHPTLLLDDLVNQFFARVGWILIPGVALLFLVSLLTIQAELRPIEHVAAVAETIGPHSLGVRLPDRFIPREVMPLIETVNEALDRLERTLQAQREFTADAAHELKTPLAVLRAQLDAMARDATTDALRADVDAMSRLVTQLLRLAEADQLAVPPEARCDLAAVARDVTAAIAPLALARNRSLDLDGAEAPVWVRGLAGPLAQALRNLVENALRHTAEGTVVAVAVAADGTLSVRDHGPGIAEADVPNLFRRFWRKARHEGGGAGLGLAITAKIVEAHGGRIAVESPADGGARFVIALEPLSAAA